MVLTAWIVEHGGVLWPSAAGALVAATAWRSWQRAGAESERQHQHLLASLETHGGLFDGALAVRGVFCRTDDGDYIDVGGERVRCAAPKGAKPGHEVVAIGAVARHAASSYRGQGGYSVVPKTGKEVDLVPVRASRSHKGFLLAPLLTAFALLTGLVVLGVAGLSLRSRFGAFLASATPLRERALERAEAHVGSVDERIHLMALRSEYCGPIPSWLFGERRFLEAAGHALACEQPEIAVPALIAAGHPRDAALYAAPLIQRAPAVATAAYILAEQWGAAAAAAQQLEGRYCTSVLLSLFAGEPEVERRLKAFSCQGERARLTRAVELTTSVYEPQPWEAVAATMAETMPATMKDTSVDVSANESQSSQTTIPAWHVARWWRDHPTLANNLPATMGFAWPRAPRKLSPATSTVLDYLALQPRGAELTSWSMLQSPRVRYALGELYSGRPLLAANTRLDAPGEATVRVAMER